MLEIKSYESLVPDSSWEPERRFFLASIEAILAVRRNESGFRGAADGRAQALVDAAGARYRDHNLTLEGLKKELQLRDAAAWLGQLFRRSTGFSFHSYLRRLRMCEAARLLMITDKAVKEIRYEVGYANDGNFAHDFTKEIGVAPAAFRKGKAEVLRRG